MWGKGFLQGTQGHLDFLPEKQTDFIFTMIGEEFGFVGGVAVMALLGLIVLGGMAIALRCRHQFGRLVAFGIAINFFLYVFVNIAMVMGAIPVGGVPLPLVSHGGSAMITVMIGFGAADVGARASRRRVRRGAQRRLRPIPPRLLRAYRDTAIGPRDSDVRIGRRCPDALFERLNADAAMFLTAWNPRSRRMPDGWNHRMQQQLRQCLRRFKVLEAEGSLRRWHEAMLLVAGDPRPVVRLAVRFRQRAVVILRRGHRARLPLCPILCAMVSGVGSRPEGVRNAVSIAGAPARRHPGRGRGRIFAPDGLDEEGTLRG